MPDRTAQMQLLVDYYLGYNATLVIRLGADTGLWQALAQHQPVTADGLAAALEFEPRYVAHFLHTAQALRLLERESGGYALTEHMDKLLADPAHSSYLAGMAGFHTISGRDFERMPQWLRSGETYSFQAHEDDFIAGVGEVTAGIARFFARSVIPQLPGIEGRAPPRTGVRTRTSVCRGRLSRSPVARTVRTSTSSACSWAFPGIAPSHQSAQAMARDGSSPPRRRTRRSHSASSR